jgi:hypothetical protein
LAFELLCARTDNSYVQEEGQIRGSGNNQPSFFISLFSLPNFLIGTCTEQCQIKFLERNWILETKKRVLKTRRPAVYEWERFRATEHKGSQNDKFA